MSSSSTTKLTLKLLIDTKIERVLFAEASKPVVDFLFNMLCLPIGNVVKLLNKNEMVGSLGNLYQSVENLNHNYMQSDHQTKDILLNPSAPIGSIEIFHLFPPLQKALRTSSGVSDFILTAELDDDEDQEEDEEYDDEEEEETEEDDEETIGGETLLYVCPKKCSYDVTCDKTTLCSRCKKPMNRETSCVGKKFDEEYLSINNGFVKDVVTFMVMDDLSIQPMPTLSGITILNKFNIKEMGTLQEMVVEFGVEEGSKLLKASLQSKMVLTSVFIKKEY
ncbi:uncharacterized protein [Medicago truncatula]|uniref:uncharacterized protein n=1 Tax=Medicago truncatula TaxID=3880 RepID=UPI000D2F35E4|nr:uncharacterized protein LOC11413354 [Medicago truncatula]